MVARTSRYAVLTPFEQAKVVAGVCKLAGFDVEVLPTDSGAVVVRELAAPVYDEWDIRNITGPDDEDIELAEAAGTADLGSAVAAHLSRLSRYGVILFDVTLAEDAGFEAGVSGEIKARRYQGGKAGEEIPAGLLVASLDSRIESFLLGELDLEKEPELVRGANISAMDLARMAFRGGRPSRSRRSRETAEPAESASAGESPREANADGPAREGEEEQ